MFSATYAPYQNGVNRMYAPAYGTIGETAEEGSKNMASVALGMLIGVASLVALIAFAGGPPGGQRPREREERRRAEF
jgi:hypothetical protein